MSVDSGHKGFFPGLAVLVRVDAGCLLSGWTLLNAEALCSLIPGTLTPAQLMPSLAVRRTCPISSLPSMQSPPLLPLWLGSIPSKRKTVCALAKMAVKPSETIPVRKESEKNKQPRCNKVVLRRRKASPWERGQCNDSVHSSHMPITSSPQAPAGKCYCVHFLDGSPVTKAQGKKLLSGRLKIPA